MLLYVKLLGDGTEKSPYRVGLPTYKIVGIDYGGRVAVVDVPEDDLPPGFEMDATVETKPTAWGYALRVPKLQGWERLRAHLVNRYAPSPLIHDLDI